MRCLDARRGLSAPAPTTAPVPDGGPGIDDTTDDTQLGTATIDGVVVVARGARSDGASWRRGVVNELEAATDSSVRTVRSAAMAAEKTARC